MIVNANLKLEGQYTVDVYRKDGSLSYSIGPKPNFITNTGMSMPFRYSFADCFRFISLGFGTNVNTIKLNSGAGLGTTGLSQPFGTYSYIGGRSVAQDVGHATSQYSHASFSEVNNKVSLSRSWRIPPGTDTFPASYDFKEFMLSPGRPAVTGISSTQIGAGGPFQMFAMANGTQPTITVDGTPGWTDHQFVNQNNWVLVRSNSNDTQIRKIIDNVGAVLYTQGQWTTIWTEASDLPTMTIYPQFSLCYSSASDIDVRDPLGVTQFGPDFASCADEYDRLSKPICSQTGAFVRVVNDIPVNAGDYLLVNYILNITVNSGSGEFHFAVTRSRSVGDPNNWSPNVSGCSSLVHHGLRLISPGSVAGVTPWGAGMAQPSTQWNADYDYGESFIGAWGCPLEPSTTSLNLRAYVSSDYLQFAVNQVNGGKGDAAFSYYNQKSGLMGWRSTPYLDASVQFPINLYNIRQPNGTNGNTNYTPCTKDFRTDISDYSNDPTNPACNDAGWAAVFAYQTQDTAIAWSNPSFTISDRTRTITRNLEFDGPSIDPNMIGIPIRNLVLAYNAVGVPGYDIPYMDIQFTDTGKHLVPAPNRYNGAASPWHLDTGNNGNQVGLIPKWNYLEVDAKLNFWFNEIWTTNCDSSVDGC